MDAKADETCQHVHLRHPVISGLLFVDMYHTPDPASSILWCSDCGTLILYGDQIKPAVLNALQQQLADAKARAALADSMRKVGHLHAPESICARCAWNAAYDALNPPSPITPGEAQGG